MRVIFQWKSLIIVSLFVIIGISAFGSTPKTYAETANGFNAGEIISDSVFTNANSMNPAQIQAFLNMQVPTCDTNGTQPSEYGGGTRAQWAANASLHPAEGAFYPPFTCLKDYTENGLSSAQIIYNIAQQYEINPQVLIVLLQKEQGLVTDTWPSPSQYTTATGYGCPDSTPGVCASQYYGFTNQLTLAAALFHGIIIGDPAFHSSFSLGNNNVLWSPNTACGSGVVNIQNRSTQALYTYTPYQPDQAAINAGYGTGDSCSSYGNRNFYLYFRDWFGYNSGPAAFTTAGSSTIYVPVDGYKLAVPYMAALQDYGVSTNAIQTVSQAYEDSMPIPPVDTGISSSIAHVVKSPYDTDEDGGSIYLISLGKRYQFQSMQQFTDFGWTTSDISYLPLSYIFSMPNGGALSNFVTSPYQNVFDVTDSGKQIIFDYNAYITRNPSDIVTPLSYYLADKIPSSNPIADSPILIKYNNSNAVYLYQNGTYYAIPDYSTFSDCWGFDKPSTSLPVYQPAENAYIAPITTTTSLSCIVNDGQNNLILDGTVKYTVPSSLTLTELSLNADLKALSDKIPTSPTALSPYVKGSDSAAVWYINSSTKRVIPTYANFLLLGLSTSNVDTISPNVIDAIPTNGIKLADGQLVKTTTSAAIYSIAGNQRVLYPSSDLFTAYGNNWNTIETYSASDLDQFYPFNGASVSDYLVNSSSSKAYIIGQNGCFELSNATLTALGTSYSALAASQSYNSNAFVSLPTNCRPSSSFIQLAGQSLVYWVNGGTKYPLNTYSALLSKNGGQQPVIMQVTSAFISSLPTGSAFN